MRAACRQRDSGTVHSDVVADSPGTPPLAPTPDELIS